MKPQLIIQDFQGVRSSDFDKTREKLTAEAAWKQQRTIVILPAGQSIPAKVALSHWNIAWPPNNGVVRILAQGLEVGQAYSLAIQGVIDHPELSKWEYILTVEHDNCPPSDGVLKLVESMDAHPEFSCISGLYFTKGEGGVAQIWGDPKDPVLNFRPQVPQLDQLIECCGTGMGFALWRLPMFKDSKLRKPWFETYKSAEGLMTQDLYFWADARKYGYRCAVDCRVRVGHYDSDADIVW